MTYLEKFKRPTSPIASLPFCLLPSLLSLQLPDGCAGCFTTVDSVWIMLHPASQVLTPSHRAFTSLTQISTPASLCREQLEGKQTRRSRFIVGKTQHVVKMNEHKIMSFFNIGLYQSLSTDWVINNPFSLMGLFFFHVRARAGSLLGPNQTDLPL